MRVVLDPNVLVSAVVASGVSAALLDRWLTDWPFELVVCPILIGELRDVLQRPKFRRWITAGEATVFVDRLAREASAWTDPTELRPLPGIPRMTTSSPCTEAAGPICWYPGTRTCSSWQPPTSSS